MMCRQPIQKLLCREFVPTFAEENCVFVEDGRMRLIADNLWTVAGRDPGRRNFVENAACSLTLAKSPMDGAKVVDDNDGLAEARHATE